MRMAYRRDSDLFPAHAGMNRYYTADLLRQLAVPRTRGDEPAQPQQRIRLGICSPHTRG